MKCDTLGHGHGCCDRMRTSQYETQTIQKSCVHEEFNMIICVAQSTCSGSRGDRAWIDVKAVVTSRQRGTSGGYACPDRQPPLESRGAGQ